MAAVPCEVDVAGEVPSAFAEEALEAGLLGERGAWQEGRS